MTAARWSRVALVLLAAALLVAAFVYPTDPLPGGGKTLQGWWLSTAAFALLVLAWGLGTAWQRTSWLVALFVAGTAAQLGLTQPLWLQWLKLPPWMPETKFDLVLRGALLLQIVAVPVLATRLERRFWQALRRFFTPLRLLVALGLFVVCAAHISLYYPTGKMPVWFQQLAMVGVLFSINFLHVTLIAGSFPRRELLEWRDRLASRIGFPGTPGAPSAWDRRLPWILAAAATLAPALVTVVVFELQPRVDEVTYLLQASHLAEGRLTGDHPPIVEPFAVYSFHSLDGKWFGTNNPGWPSALAVGVFFGLPWLVNPLLGGLGAWFVHRLVRRWADMGTAHAVTFLLVVSPWALYLAGSLMTHTVTLPLLAGSWLLLERVRSGGHWMQALPAGMCLGYVGLVRPLEGLLLAVATGLGCLGLFRPRIGWRALVLFILGGAVVAGLALPYNNYLTGDPLVFPFESYIQGQWSNRLGFGDAGPPGWGLLDPWPGHHLRDVLVALDQNFYNLNFELFGWTTGSLIFVVAHLLAGRWSRLDRFLMMLCLILMAGYTLYWFSGGSGYGARYWYSMLIPMCWLTVRGVQTVAGYVARFLPAPEAGVRVAAVAGMLIVVSIGCFPSWRAVGHFWEYRGSHTDYRKLERENDFGKSLVFVRSPSPSDFLSAYSRNPSRLDSDRPLYVKDLGPETNGKLARAFPDRQVWLLEGRENHKDRARVVAGPLPPGTTPPDAGPAPSVVE